MPASTAIVGPGTTLTVADTSGGTYTAIAEVIDIKKGLMVDKTKVSHLTSPSYRHEYIPAGLTDPGEVSFTANFTKAQYATIYGYFRTTKYWKITTPDNSVWAFAGFWSKLDVTVPDNDRVTVDVTIACTGVETFTAGA